MDPNEATPAEETSARRIRWGIRFLFYPVLIALIALAWHVRQARPSSVPPAPDGSLVYWSGRTGAGGVVYARSVGGRLVHLEADLAYQCPTRRVQITWQPRAREAHLRQDGRQVSGRWGPGRWMLIRPSDSSRTSSGQFASTVEAQMGVEPTGTIRGELTLLTPGRPAELCRTRGAVPFTLREVRPSG